MPDTPNEVLDLAPLEAAGKLEGDEWPAVLETFLGSKIERENTRRAYRRHLEALATWCKAEGVRTPAALSTALLGRYRAELLAGDVGPATCSQAIAAIRSFVRWARVFAPHLPGSDVLREVFALPRAKVERPYSILTPAEAGALLDAAEADGAKSFALVALMLGAGLRVSETTALEIRSLVETDRGELLVHVQGKGGCSRTVPLGKDVVDVVRAYLHASGRSLGDGGRLFVAEDRGATSRDTASMTPNAVFLILRRLVDRAGIRAKTVSPHSLRHTFAVRYLRAGRGDVAALQKILGHASLTTTQRYVDHLQVDELAETMPALRTT
ncbi:MAG: tyrosine-type recombinase/integrase [bacterium]|nr:tyrosine-type recombinase/integrase [bacterium]